MTEPTAAEATGQEESLAQIIESSWCRAINVPAVSDDDDFFDIGGHSLAVTRIVLYLRRRLGVEVDMIQVWETPVFGEFREVVEKMVRSS